MLSGTQRGAGRDTSIVSRPCCNAAQLCCNGQDATRRSCSGSCTRPSSPLLSRYACTNVLALVLIWCRCWRWCWSERVVTWLCWCCLVLIVVHVVIHESDLGHYPYCRQLSHSSHHDTSHRRRSCCRCCPCRSYPQMPMPSSSRPPVRAPNPATSAPGLGARLAAASAPAHPAFPPASCLVCPLPSPTLPISPTVKPSLRLCADESSEPRPIAPSLPEGRPREGPRAARVRVRSTW